MARDLEARSYDVVGKALRCPHCGHDKFWTRSTLMNTKGATFAKLDWLNKQASNYVCDRCGHVLWFLDKP